jgi:hypothetical protein
LVCVVGPLPADFPGIKPASAAFAVVCIQLVKHRKTVCKRPDAPFGAGFVTACTRKWSHLEPYRLGMRHARRIHFDPLPLPVRSPELMPHDFSIWRRILALMQAHEDSPGYVRETVPVYKVRLRNTAVGLGAAYIRSVQAKIQETARRIIAKEGGHVNEGTKRTGDR